MTEEPRRELHLFFTRKGRKALILYRASTQLYRLIGWDTARDRFEPGQWLKSRVFEDGCALSPDGRHFVYGALLRGDPYVAISKPPYFSAVEFFPGVFYGETAAFFPDNQSVALCFLGRGGPERDLACGLRVDPSPGHWSYMRTSSEWKRTPPEDIDRIQKTIDDRRGAPDTLTRCYRCDGTRLYRKGSSGDRLLLDCSDMEFEPVAPHYPALTREDWA